MTNQNQNTNKPRENAGNERTVNNPKPPGRAERVDPNTGGTAGTVDGTDAGPR